MRYSTMIIVGLTAVVAASLIAEDAWALTSTSGTQTAAGTGFVIVAAGTGASVPVIQVDKKGGGHHKGGFRWGFYGGRPGWYGGYYSPYGYQGGSYLDTPTRTCVWNGYEYKCYEFEDETY